MTFSKWMLFLSVLCIAFFIESSSSDILGSVLDTVYKLLDHESPQQSYPKCGNYKIEILTPIQLLGLSPHWDDESRSVYFTDAFRIAVLRYFIDSGVLVSAQVINTSILKLVSQLGKSTNGSGVPTDLYNPVQFLGFIIPTNEKNKYLMNFGDELGLLSWDGQSILSYFQEITQPDPTHPFPFYTLFDGKISPNGSLVFYTVPVPFGNLLPVNPKLLQALLTPQNQSTLFGICNRKQKTLRTGYTFGDSIGFSPDGKWLYYSDSFARILYKAQFDQVTCSIYNTRTLVDLGKKNRPGLPGGLTVDKQGYLWLVENTAGQILKINPETGNVSCVIETSIQQLNDLTFGRCPGEKNGKLNCLYVTSMFFNATQSLFNNLTLPSLNDGSLILIKDFGAEGLLDQKVNLKNIFDSEY